MPATPRKARRFGGSAAHQKSMMANLCASLFAAEAIETTEAKAKALRPVAEKLITKACSGTVHDHRNVVKFLRDREMASKLFDEIAPPVRGSSRGLHADPQAGQPPRRQRTHGEDRTGLATSPNQRFGLGFTREAPNRVAEPDGLGAHLPSASPPPGGNAYLLPSRPVSREPFGFLGTSLCELRRSSFAQALGTIRMLAILG